MRIFPPTIHEDAHRAYEDAQLARRLHHSLHHSSTQQIQRNYRISLAGYEGLLNEDEYEELKNFVHDLIARSKRGLM